MTSAFPREYVGTSLYGGTVTIGDQVPGGMPGGAKAAMTAGLTTMGAPDLDVIVTTDFVSTVQALTEDPDYHDDRNGGAVAARTVTTSNDDILIVANWTTLHDESLAEIERVLAHEAGHAAIAGRSECVEMGIYELFPTNFWEFQSAHGAGVAIDEYRCEAAVYKAGYPVERGRTDLGIGEELFGLNIQLIGADHLYQQHLDVAQLRDEVLKVVLLNVRYMGCIAARHHHHDAVDSANLNMYASQNWATLIEPTWSAFLDLYANVPDALSAWPDPAGRDTAASAVPLIHNLTSSFGYKASQDGAGNDMFHIIMNDQQRHERLHRANAEADGDS